MGLLLKLKDGDTSLKSLRYGQDRPGGGDSGQPFIKTDIPNEQKPPRPLDIDGFVRGGLDAPKSAEEDSKRLSNYLFNFNNPSGLLFIAKQNVLSRTAPKTEASFGAAYGGSKKTGLIQGSENNFINKNGALVSTGTYRKGPAGVNEGIYTPLSTIAQARVGYLGKHLNKQGLDPSGNFPAASINKYQEVAFENNKESNNGHLPDIPITLLRRQKRLERKGSRLVDRSIRLENKFDKSQLKLNKAFDDLTKTKNTPAKIYQAKIKKVYFKPDFQSRQLQKLGITGQMKANTNQPIPAGSYPIVPSGNPNNVQGITFSQQGPTGRFKNVAYNNFQKKKKQVLDKMSQTWRDIQINLAEGKLKRKGKKYVNKGNKKIDNDARIEKNFNAQDAIQAEINDIKGGPSAYENRLLKLWNKIGLEVGKEFPFSSPNLLSYGGGPGSALGIGKTNIKFSTLNDGLTPYRTGWNSRRANFDYNGWAGNLDPKILKDQQYNWRQILRNSATYQYLNIKDDNGNYVYNDDYYNYEDVFGKDWYSNFQLKETNNHQGFMPWEYTLPEDKVRPKQSKIDLEHGNTVRYKIYEKQKDGQSSKYLFPKKSQIRNLGDAGSNIVKTTNTLIHPAQRGKLSKTIYDTNNVKVKRKDGELVDLIEFTIVLQKGSSAGSNSGKMYLMFPAYISNINDSFSSNYKTINYMGRPEPFYKYSGFRRDISFSFVVVAQSRAEVKNMYDKLNLLASSIAPSYTNAGYMSGNVSYLTIGDMYVDQPGIINGFSFGVPEEVTWDIGLGNPGDEYTKEENGETVFASTGSQHPMMIKVDGFKFTPLYKSVPTFGTDRWIGSDQIISNDSLLKKEEIFDKTKEEQDEDDDNYMEFDFEEIGSEDINIDFT